MDLYTHIKTFNVTARCQSFSEAAHHLNVVPSVVSKRIAQLEHITKITLFDRSTRTIALTQAGERFLQRSTSLIEDMDTLVSNAPVSNDELEGHIRILSPITLTLMQLNQVFNDFLQRHPKLSFDVSLIDITTNPIERGFDLAISGRPAIYEGVTEFFLTPTQTQLYASPEYLIQHGEITHPNQLTKHHCLSFKTNGTTWRFQTHKSLLEVHFQPRIALDDNLSLAHAAAQGLGIAPLPLYISEPFLASKAITPVLPHFPLQTSWFKMFIPNNKKHLSPVKKLAQHIYRFYNEAELDYD